MPDAVGKEETSVGSGGATIGSDGSSTAPVVRGEIAALAAKKIKMSAGTNVTHRAPSRVHTDVRARCFVGSIPLPKFPTGGILP